MYIVEPKITVRNIYVVNILFSNGCYTLASLMAIFVPIFHFNYQLQNKNCKTNDMFFCYPLKEHINVIHRDPHLYESHAVVFTNTKMT